MQSYKPTEKYQLFTPGSCEMQHCTCKCNCTNRSNLLGKFLLNIFSYAFLQKSHLFIAVYLLANKRQMKLCETTYFLHTRTTHSKWEHSPIRMVGNIAHHLCDSFNNWNVCTERSGDTLFGMHNHWHYFNAIIKLNEIRSMWALSR